LTMKSKASRASFFDVGFLDIAGLPVSQPINALSL
jgi:hypothetical protein